MAATLPLPNKLTQSPRCSIQFVIKMKCPINSQSLWQSSDNVRGCEWMMRPTVSKPISGRRVHDPVRRRGCAGRGQRHPIFGRGFKKTVPDDEETAKCRSGRIMEPPLEMVIRRVCPCTLHPPPPPFQRTSCFLPSRDLLPAHSERLLLFVIFYAVISISMKEHRWINRFRTEILLSKLVTNPPPDLNCWNGVPPLQQGLVLFKSRVVNYVNCSYPLVRRCSNLEINLVIVNLIIYFHL